MREKFLYWLAGIFKIAIMAVPAEVKVNPRGSLYDSTRFTRTDFDIIQTEFALHTLNNTQRKGRKIGLDELTGKLNEILGYAKSQTSYSRVWSGSVNRASLGEI